MALTIGVTLATGVTTEATGDVAEAEAGVMIVENEAAKLRENTEIDEMIEVPLRSIETIEDEIDGDGKLSEVGDNPHLKDEAAPQHTPHARPEMHRQV